MSDFKHGRNGYVKHKCRCDECKTGNSVYRKQLRDSKPTSRFAESKIPRLSAQPLIDMLRRAERLNEIHPTMLKRWETKGLNIYWADTWAIRFGWHPVEIWGMDFYQGIEYEEVA